MDLQVNKLQYFLLPGYISNTGYSKIYLDCYELWKRVWSEALKELGNKNQIYSDGFTRQTKIGCIYFEDKCVAMSAFREIDLSFYPQQQDSLLQAWTSDALHKLVADGSRVSICSYLTVSPEFRGPIADEMTMKLLTVLMSVKCLLNSDCDVMSGTMRCNRGTDKSAYRAGARFLQKSTMYGVEVDLVGFFKQEIRNEFHKFSHIWSEYLWQNRVDLCSEQIFRNRPTKKLA
ncbi:MAG: hypothetical protein ACXVCP_01235 [Bdellovibrio sp.]